MENTTDTLQIKITEARNLLSKESREAIDNVNWKLTILGMDKKYNPEQLENLETETELLLCGILNPEDYPKELENRMRISKEETTLLINEMDRLIFKKIQEELEKGIASREKVLTENKPLVFDPMFLSMPKNVQEAIASSNWKEKLYNIAEKYKLPIPQMGVLEEITIKVMKDEIHPDKYESELASKITIVKEDISNLVNDVNEDILKNIRELLKTHWNEEDKKEEIPIPPYAKTETKVETLKAEETAKSISPIQETTSFPPQNIIEEKLKSATVSDHTVSDYSTPSIKSENNSNPSIKPHDPYREPME